MFFWKKRALHPLIVAITQLVTKRPEAWVVYDSQKNGNQWLSISYSATETVFLRNDGALSLRSSKAKHTIHNYADLTAAEKKITKQLYVEVIRQRMIRAINYRMPKIGSDTIQDDNT